MTTTREYVGGDRYQFDFGRFHYKHGWAQVDTGQDASYFGVWAHPGSFTIATFCEGDLTVQTTESWREFVAEIHRIREWNIEQGHEFKGIDGMCDDAIIGAFADLGLSDLMH